MLIPRAVPLALLLSSLGLGACAADDGDDEDRSLVSNATAAVRQEIQSVDHLALDRASGKLTYSYVIGGGCAEHKSTAEVELSESASGLVAKVKVFDVASGEDFCEALLSLDGTADLQALIADAASKKKLDIRGKRVTVDLPDSSLEVRRAATGDAPAAAGGEPISTLSSLKLDPGTGRLDVGYVTGGGCQEHTPVVRVKLVKTAAGVQVDVDVHDSSPSPDFCEALISVNGSVDLSALIAQEAKKTGQALDGQTVTLELPHVELEAK